MADPNDWFNKEGAQILFSEHLQLNVAFDGAANNVGVSYLVPHIFADYVSVSASGLVTPLALPPDHVAGVIVEAVITSTGEDLEKFLIVIRQTAPGTLGIALALPDNTPALIRFLEGYWTDADNLVHVNWIAPTDPESGIVKSVLTVRSVDGLDVLTTNENVLGLTSWTYPHNAALADTQYVVILTVTNGAGQVSSRQASFFIAQDGTPPVMNGLVASWAPSQADIYWATPTDPDTGLNQLTLTVMSLDGSLVLLDGVDVRGLNHYMIPNELQTNVDQMFAVVLTATNGVGLQSSQTTNFEIPPIGTSAVPSGLPPGVVPNPNGGATWVDPPTSGATWTPTPAGGPSGTPVSLSPVNPSLPGAGGYPNPPVTMNPGPGGSVTVTPPGGSPVPVPPPSAPNAPNNVSVVDNLNGTVTVSFENTDATMVQRPYSLGVRQVDSTADAVNGNAGLLYLLPNHVLFDGKGPHSVTFPFAGSASPVEFFVQDAVDLLLDSTRSSTPAGVTIPPFSKTETVFSSFAGVWQPNEIDLNWGAFGDELGQLNHVTLTVKSQDGKDVLANGTIISNAGGASAALPRDRDGLTYNATLTAYDSTNYILDVTTIVVQVPQSHNAPVGVSVHQDGFNKVTLTWSNTEAVVGRTFFLGARLPHTSGNAFQSSFGLLVVSPATTKTGSGPVSFQFDMGQTASGNLEFFVQDAITRRVGYVDAAYVADDLSAPVVSIVGSYDANTQTLTFTLSSSDPQSGIAGQFLSVSNGGNTLANALDVTGLTTKSFTGVAADSSTYNATLRATNGVGLNANASTSVLVLPATSFFFRAVPENLLFDWSAVTIPADSYTFRILQDGATLVDGITPSAAGSYVAAQVSDSTSHQYTLGGVSAANGTFTPIAQVTGTEPSAGTAISNIAATQVNANSLNVSFDSYGSSSQTYRVSVKDGSNVVQRTASAASSGTSHSFSFLPLSGGTYTVEVVIVANNANGNGFPAEFDSKVYSQSVTIAGFTYALPAIAAADNAPAGYHVSGYGGSPENVGDSAPPYASHSLWEMFDRNDNTYFYNNVTSGAHMNKIETQIQAPSAFTAKGFRLVAPTLQAPTGWTVSGSNDGTTWTDVDVVAVGSQPASSTERFYSFSAPGAYVYYRLEMDNTYADPNGFPIIFLYTIDLLTW